MKKCIVGMSLLFICSFLLIACDSNEFSNKHNNTAINEVEQENISDENGIIELEADGYKIRFALVLMHSPVVNENTIYVLGEHENIKQDGKQMGIPPSIVKVNDDIKSRDTFSVGPLEANAETTITSMIPLEDAIEPDTLEIIFQKPTELESITEEESIDNDGEAWKVMKFKRK